MPGTVSFPFGALPEPLALAFGQHGPGRCGYRLQGLWQLHLYPYAATAVIGGERLAIRPGTAGLTPPGAQMQYDLAARVGHAYAHFAMPRGTPVAVPVLVDLGAGFAAAERALLEAVPWLVTAPERAAVRLWDVLGTVLAAAPATPAVDLATRARARIEALLAGPVSVAGLAADLGCSREHLSRTLQAAVGQSVVAYVRS
jgi:AraC family transcriptional regulator